MTVFGDLGNRELGGAVINAISVSLDEELETLGAYLCHRERADFTIDTEGARGY